MKNHIKLTKVKKFLKISTQTLTVLTIGAILHVEQRKEMSL